MSTHNGSGWDRADVVSQGIAAYMARVPRSDNPYRYTPNSRQGDAKRAYWEAGWDKAEALCTEPWVSA